MCVAQSYEKKTDRPIFSSQSFQLQNSKRKQTKTNKQTNETNIRHGPRQREARLLQRLIRDERRRVGLQLSVLGVILTE